MHNSRHQANHHRVLHAACALFRQDSYAISMDAVATQAGVSKQTVYSHFDSKQILFRAVVEELVRPLHDALKSSSTSLESLLRSLAIAYQADAEGHSSGAIARVLQTDPPRALPALRNLVDALCDDARARLATRLRSAMERGQLRNDDPDIAAEMFFALVRGLRGGPTLVDTAVHTFLDAYSARRVPPTISRFPQDL
jgi:TetR/AcrR family transcriptional regulator, mexJK operon transcriptional repressor